MRICIISPCFPPTLGWDGSNTNDFELARALKRAGHEIEIIALDDEAEFTAFQDGMKVHRCKIREDLTALKMVPKTTPNTLTLLSSRRGIWKKFLEVHARQPFDLVDTASALWEGLIPGIFGLLPVVVRLQRDLCAYDLMSLSSSSAFQIDNELLAQGGALTTKLADAVYAPFSGQQNQAMASSAGASGLNGHGGVAKLSELFDPTAYSPEGEIALPRNYERSVTVRTRINQSNVFDYLKQVIELVFAEYAETRFVILAEDITSDEQEYHAREKIKEFVKEPGEVILMRSYHQLLPEFLRSAPICFISAEVEAGSYAWIEAMSLKRAVVAVRESGEDEYLKDGTTALVIRSLNAADAARAIIAVKRDKDLLERIASGGRKLVEERFGKSTAPVSSIEAVYRSALENFANPSKRAQRAAALESMMEGMESLLISYDRMLYDLLFTESHRFKMRHWLNKLSGMARRKN